MANATLVDNNTVPLGTATNPIYTAPGTGTVTTLAASGRGVKVSFDRTADTNAYAANDVIGPATAAQTFASIGPAAGGEVIITSAALEIDLTSVTSGMTSFSLALYNVTPPSALGDNGAWTLPSGDRASYLGTINLGSPVLPVTSAGTLYVATDQINKQITLASGSLFAYLITAGAYTPASGTTYRITLHTVAP